MSLIESYYKEYTCSYSNPLNCDRPLQTAESVKGAKFCWECGFPAILEEKAEIKGSRGNYQITNLLGVRGLGRLYSGIHLQNKQAVTIKEYLLPTRSFNDEEASKRKETFKRVAGVTLADGRNQNFRIINYPEAIADEKVERCYLITNDVEPSETLSKYLMEKGAMTPSAIRRFLNQTLQTLEFSHTQKLRLPANQIKSGLAHGNISLDTILIREESNENFYIYFCDLALWESLFIPPSIPQSAPAKLEDDLKSLGLVAFYLWVGKVKDDSGNQFINPRDVQNWPNNDSYLKQYLYNLIGLDAPFENAQVARQLLLQLPIEEEVNSLTPHNAGEAEEKQRFRRLLIFLLIFLVFLLVGGGIWFLLRMQKESFVEKASSRLLEGKCFSDVPNVQPGNFLYIGEKESTWSYALQQSPKDEKRLNDFLTNPIPKVQATFKYQTTETDEESLKQKVSKPLVKLSSDSNKYSFAITSLNKNITDDLNKEHIAYDGLLVFVPSSKKSGNLLSTLGEKISLENLRLIYTGKITNWKKLGGPDLAIIPYAPIEPEAIRLFQQIVLKDDEQNIANFEKTIIKQNTRTTIQEIIEQNRKNQNPGIII
jgi:serine/threonine protein kinase